MRSACEKCTDLVPLPLQVLQHAFFGGTEEGVRAVSKVQREGKDRDGEFG